MSEHEEIIIGKEVMLEQWLQLMEKRPKYIVFEHYQFPTDEIKEQFLNNIFNYSEEIVMRILDSFLLSAGSLGFDVHQLDYLVHLMENDKKEAKRLIKDVPYYKSLMAAIGSRGKAPVRDGIKWIMDLLPYSPREALDALSAYIHAHIAFLPDGRIYGLCDAEAILRARYFSTDYKVATSILNSLKPVDLEHIVEALYYTMSFTTEMTKASHDGGRDIIATKHIPGLKETNLIQCKRWQNVISVEDVRALLGVISYEKATKGTLVTTSHFSPDAKKLAKSEPRIELIPLEALQQLLSEHLGTMWITKTDYLINESIKRHPLDKRKRA